MSYYNLANVNANACNKVTTWTRDEDHVFEMALKAYPEGYPNRWELISIHLPRMTVNNVKDHYLNKIESGLIKLSLYPENKDCVVQKPFDTPQNPIPIVPKKYKAKKPKPWTDEEHKLFLVGLERYGKGDWKSISRHVIRSRTSIQVASHAQKYFLHLENLKNSDLVKKTRKRRSINDITLSDEPIIPTLPINFSMPASTLPSPPPMNSGMLESLIIPTTMQQEQPQGVYSNYYIPTSY